MTCKKRGGNVKLTLYCEAEHWLEQILQIADRFA